MEHLIFFLVRRGKTHWKTNSRKIELDCYCCAFEYVCHFAIACTNRVHPSHGSITYYLTVSRCVHWPFFFFLPSSFCFNYSVQCRYSLDARDHQFVNWVKLTKFTLAHAVFVCRKLNGMTEMRKENGIKLNATKTRHQTTSTKSLTTWFLFLFLSVAFVRSVDSTFFLCVCSEYLFFSLIESHKFVALDFCVKIYNVCINVDIPPRSHRERLTCMINVTSHHL